MSPEKLYVVFLVLPLINVCYSAEERNSSNLDTRIVGGDVVDIRHCPYQVSIQFYNQHFCGGALITPNTVLTAAHCFGKSSPTVNTLYEVKVGSNTTSGVAYKIGSILVHPNYSSITIDCDISLVKLRSNVSLSPTIQPVRISEKDTYRWGTYASVSGWGYQSENGSVSPVLRKVELPLRTRGQCQESYAGIINITKNMICAGYREGGKDACQGDSGGPLVQNGRLIGIVSFGMGCARKSYPGVYTNVAQFLDWVVANSNYTTNGGGGYFEILPMIFAAIIIVLLLY